MIVTEQNKNNTGRNKPMDATQTFTVQPHTAEALKNRINAANAQAQRSSQAGGAPRRHRVNAVQPVQRSTADGAVRQSVPVKTNAGVVRGNVQQNQAVQRSGESAPVVRSENTAAGTAVRASGAQVQPRPVQQRTAVPAEKRPVQVQPNRQSAPVQKKTVAAEPLARTVQAQPTVKKKEKYAGSDEGGNTVVSVVKAIVYIVFVMIISVFLAMVIINVGNDMFAFVKSDELVEVSIPEYATLNEVTDVLYKNDIIRYPKIFKLFAVIKEDNRKYVAGNYTVHGMMNYEDLLDAFKEKPVTGIKKITIPEGFTTDEIIDLFVAEGIGTREGYVDVIQNYEFDYWFIDELNETGMSEDRIYRLDGYLFPDTYEFYMNSSEATVINKLLKRFSQIFTKEYREQSDAFGYTVDEVITLASIIEKEAASPSEFFVISSIFHNRLNNPWIFPKLESDATIVYQMQHESGERPQLTGKDLEVDLAYNTYTNDGLPPGPIANPSASAMLAALSPVTSNYFFFYHYKGTIYTSETKAEHDAIVAQFRDAAEEQTVGDIPPVMAQ